MPKPKKVVKLLPYKGASFCVAEWLLFIFLFLGIQAAAEAWFQRALCQSLPWSVMELGNPDDSNIASVTTALALRKWLFQEPQGWLLGGCEAAFSSKCQLLLLLELRALPVQWLFSWETWMAVRWINSVVYWFIGDSGQGWIKQCRMPLTQSLTGTFLAFCLQTKHERFSHTLPRALLPTAPSPKHPLLWFSFNPVSAIKKRNSEMDGRLRFQQEKQNDRSNDLGNGTLKSIKSLLRLSLYQKKKKKRH